jgi:hypothetical protein
MQNLADNRAADCQNCLDSWQTVCTYLKQPIKPWATRRLNNHGCGGVLFENLKSTEPACSKENEELYSFDSQDERSSKGAYMIASRSILSSIPVHNFAAKFSQFHTGTLRLRGPRYDFRHRLQLVEALVPSRHHHKET